MHTLYIEICNNIEDRDDLTYSKVAEYIGASKQCMSKFKTKGVIGFRKLLRLSFLLFPSNQKEIMTQWCLRLNNNENIKQSFEYAAITRNIELLKKLIEKFRSETGTIKEYVEIYSIIYKYMINEISGFDLIKHIKKVGHIKDEPLNVLVEIIKCYTYYFQKKFHTMMETAQEAEEMLKELSEKQLFMKECFLHRLAEVLGPVYLFLNNLKAARYYASLIINAEICAKTVSDSYYIMGMSYLIEDEGSSVKYLQDSYDISKTVGDRDIEMEARLNLDFAKLYLDIELPSDSNVHLLSFQKNKNSESMKVIEEVLYQRGEEDFLVLFQATQGNSLETLYTCRERFSQQSNLYFASLTAREIQKRGENSVLIEQLINFKIGQEGNGYFEENFISCFNSYRFGDRGICA